MTRGAGFLVQIGLGMEDWWKERQQLQGPRGGRSPEALREAQCTWEGVRGSGGRQEVLAGVQRARQEGEQGVTSTWVQDLS